MERVGERANMSDAICTCDRKGSLILFLLHWADFRIFQVYNLSQISDFTHLFCRIWGKMWDSENVVLYRYTPYDHFKEYSIS